MLLRRRYLMRWLVIGLISNMSCLAFADNPPKVSMKTNMGEMVIELNPEKAPVTVKNFLEYVREGFYNGTIFHRIIPGFMIQGGGFDEKFQEKPTRDVIKIESKNGLQNKKYTIAMARTSQREKPSSARPTMPACKSPSAAAASIGPRISAQARRLARADAPRRLETQVKAASRRGSSCSGMLT